MIERQKEQGYWNCLTWKPDPSTKIGVSWAQSIHCLYLKVERIIIFRKIFWESDIYETVEAACYFLILEKDESFLADVEEAVSIIGGV